MKKAIILLIMGLSLIGSAQQPYIEVCKFDSVFTLGKYSEIREVYKEPKREGKTQTLNAVLLLDFDGHTFVKTPWTIPGLSITVAHSGLSAADQQKILDSVRFDYKDFCVTVTNDEEVYNSVPKLKRMRVVITQSYQWYGSSAGGVAMVNSFGWDMASLGYLDAPCFVFSSLLNYSTKKIQEATSHELGHTLGLSHISRYNTACVKTQEYHSGDAMFAPIMGIAYSSKNGIWWNGQTKFCDMWQDDVAKITNKLLCNAIPLPLKFTKIKLTKKQK